MVVRSGPEAARVDNSARATAAARDHSSMPDLPSTAPGRSASTARVRRILLDPRLLIGIVLVVASVAGVVAIVTASDRTHEVYVAATALSPGDVVTADDLDVRSVALGSAAAHYLAPGDVPADGVVVAHPVGAGELVAVSATGSRAGQTLTAVVVETSGLLPESVRPGATVDIWAASVEEDAPRVLVTDATVVRLVTDDALVSTGEVTAVELLVPRTRVSRVLAARANDVALAVVPAGLPLDER